MCKNRNQLLTYNKRQKVRRKTLKKNVGVSIGLTSTAGTKKKKKKIKGNKCNCKRGTTAKRGRCNNMDKCKKEL